VNQCPTCKAVLAPEVRFCPNDGTPLSDTAAQRATRTPSGQQPKSVEIELPTIVGARYRLLEVRGGGGMAKVYRAEDITLQRTVAVKLINPELRTEAEFDARFQREARIASQLQDPHIVAVHDFGFDPTHGPFLVMEFLEGQSLRERLTQDGPLPLKAVLQISGQLMLALIHAHDKGVVHRDIKPDNIFLVTQSGIRIHVRVLDFGIARILRREDVGGSGNTLTSPGAVLGTPRYMSPEQLAGHAIDARSDIYSAGLVIHEALTGQLPYTSGKKLTELLPDASPILQEVLERCLKASADERPATATEVYLRLQELGRASGVLLLPPGAMEKLIGTRRSAVVTPALSVTTVPNRVPSSGRRRLILVGLALLLLLGGIAAYWFMGGRKAGAAESLLGVSVGQSRASIPPALNLKYRVMNPWVTKQPGLSLGHVVRPADLGLSDALLAELDVGWTEDRNVIVLVADDKVKAVIVHDPHPAETGRGGKIGEREGDFLNLYSDERTLQTVDVEDARGTKIRRTIWRYDALGLGCEVEHNKIVGIALFPPAPKD
jgi:hypothetical protein